MKSAKKPAKPAPMPAGNPLAMVMLKIKDRMPAKKGKAAKR